MVATMITLDKQIKILIIIMDLSLTVSYYSLDLNECEDGSHTCSVNANCTNTEGSYICTCHESFYDNGTTCLSIRPA